MRTTLLESKLKCKQKSTDIVPGSGFVAASPKSPAVALQMMCVCVVCVVCVFVCVCVCVCVCLYVGRAC